MKPLLIFILGYPLLCMAGRTSIGTAEIEATLTRGNHVEHYTYLVDTNMMRIARNETNHPYTIDLVNLDTDAVTLIFPYNKSFMRLKPPAKDASRPAGFPNMPMPPGGLPAGIGPQAGSIGPSGGPSIGEPPVHIGPTNLPSAPHMPMMPSDTGAGMSSPQMTPGLPVGSPEDLAKDAPRDRYNEKLQLNKTGATTNLLGYACTRYELRQQDLVMEIWATDQLVPFHQWLQDPPPHRYGPQMLEEHWGDLLRAHKLFPMRVKMKNEDGQTLPFEFKIIAILPKQFGAAEAKLFQPLPNYQEVAPLPF